MALVSFCLYKSLFDCASQMPIFKSFGINKLGLENCLHLNGIQDALLPRRALFRQVCSFAYSVLGVLENFIQQQ